MVTNMNQSAAHEVIIGLGANLGDPVGQIDEAARRMQALATGEVRLSSLWRSEAVGMSDGSTGFVNAVAAFETELNANTLLSALQEIEVILGRPADHAKNVARNIDLDILDYCGELIAEPDLQVPHPMMFERLFVLLPLQELLPDYRDPVTGIGLAHWLDDAPQIEMERL
jgi:2-amino-4-hydroxy-6-hydroxymethyldihydropteridine diphosphokinase